MQTQPNIPHADTLVAAARFDITCAVSDEFSVDSVTCPVRPGVLTTGGLPFEREDFLRVARLLTERANHAHWGTHNPEPGADLKNSLDVTQLPRPTLKQRDNLRLAPEVEVLARQAAHYRAWVRKLDLDARKSQATELAETRRQIERRLERATDKQVLDATRRRYDELAAAAERHRQRLADEEAFNERQRVRAQLDGFESDASRARADLAHHASTERFVADEHAREDRANGFETFTPPQGRG